MNLVPHERPLVTHSLPLHLTHRLLLPSKPIDRVLHVQPLEPGCTTLVSPSTKLCAFLVGVGKVPPNRVVIGHGCKQCRTTKGVDSHGGVFDNRG